MQSFSNLPMFLRNKNFHFQCPRFFRKSFFFRFLQTGFYQIRFLGLEDLPFVYWKNEIMVVGVMLNRSVIFLKRELLTKRRMMMLGFFDLRLTLLFFRFWRIMFSFLHVFVRSRTVFLQKPDLNFRFWTKLVLSILVKIFLKRATKIFLVPAINMNVFRTKQEIVRIRMK